MEEEKKKKRKAKKRKNKQNKITENESSSDRALPHHDQNHVGESPEDTTDTAEMQDNDAAKIDMDPSRDISTIPPTLSEGDKQYWVDREAIFEENIKQQEKENEVHVQKVCKVEERIRQLENENSIHIHNVASLEEKNLQLQNEKDVLLQQVTVLEVQISQLRNEKDLWLQKEAGYEGKISLLVDEAATLNLKRVRLEEIVKQMEEERDTQIEKENLMEKTVSSLNADNSFLQTRVKELEESWRSCVVEKQLLKDTITTLQSQVQGLEKSAIFPYSSTGRNLHNSENGDVNSETDATAHDAVVGNVIAENTELVEKVNELNIELQGRDSMKQDSSSSSSSPITGNTESTYNTNSSALELDPKAVDGTMGFDSSEIESSEIVQIPLDEEEAIAAELEIISADQKTEVPLSDAPLIGAPFRLISFMARYVSGADLVDKK